MAKANTLDGWKVELDQAKTLYSMYVDREPEDHMSFHHYALIYFGIPFDISKEYWQNV